MERPTLGFICHIILLITLGFQYSNGQSYSLQMYHKYSNEVKQWMTSKQGLDTDDWPVEGSNEYYKALYHHDYARHGRKLAEYPSLTFSGGNETVRLPELGFLLYTVVQVGTPTVTLLVALDTGSDLFWVPCDCQECAPTSAPSYGLGFDLQTYSPSTSKTSKPVTCNNTLCDLKRKCSKSSDQCPYVVKYVSANTSTSGNLVEDILYLIPGDGSQKGMVVKAPITFGCGKVQTGSFLESAAPNGLLGLGIEPISVPTILHKSGLVSNSFSMCFPHNSIVGRFTFGDEGSSDQKETPFIIDKTHCRGRREVDPCMIVTNNSSYVMSCSGGMVFVFKMPTFQVMKQFGPCPAVATSFAFHPTDSNITAIGMEDATIQIYNCRKDEIKGKLKGHQKRITGLAFSEVLNVLVSSGADAQLCVWVINEWEKQKSTFVHSKEGRSPSSLADTRIQFHNDEVHLLVVQDSQIAIYDASKLECLCHWAPQDPMIARISSATYSCDSLLVYASFCDGSVCVFDAEDLKPRCRIAPFAFMPSISSGNTYPLVIAAHPHEPNQFALGMTDGGVLLIEPAESEGKCPSCCAAWNRSKPSSWASSLFSIGLLAGNPN